MWLSQLLHHPIYQKFAGLILYQGHIHRFWVQYLVRAHMETTNVSFSHLCFSQINEHILRWKKKNK